MNNNYLKRHEQNIDSANLLVNRYGHYASSIHCSYYSVFQLMLYVHKLEDTRFYRDRDKMDRQGSHERLINDTFSLIFSIDRRLAAQFNRGINSLKNNRVTSDYKENHIDKGFGTTSLQLARDLKQILLSAFIEHRS